jgi:hypothetical protein
VKELRSLDSRSRAIVARVACRLALCVLPAAIVLFSSSCNTLPVGYDQLRDRVSGTADTTLLPDTSDSYARYVPLGGSDLLFLGGDTSYVARLVIRFSILDTMNLDSITSFQLVLHQADTSRTMGLVCRPCSSYWAESGVSWQMADSLDHWLTPGGDFLPDTLATGTVSGDSAMFDFRYVGLDSALRATIRDCGIGVFPLDTGIVAIYAGTGSNATTTAPRLVATYTNKGKQTQRLINDAADASLIDTVATRSLPFDLLVGSGVAFRTWLTFDLDSIPSEATIARADLRFTPDTKYHRTDTIAIGASRLTESYLLKGANARYESLPSATASYYVPTDSDSVITVDIRSMVQTWVNYPETLWTNHPPPDSAPPDSLRNFGLVLTAAPEWSPLFRFRVPRSGPDAPRLYIQYVLPPEDRFHQ